MSLDELVSYTSNIRYYRLHEKSYSDNIDLIFPNWNYASENIAIISPQDDDALLGAGYLMISTALNGAKIYVVIMCDSRARYLVPELKNKIVEIRKAETIEAYDALDISPDRIIRFNYPDFSLGARSGWMYPDGYEGIFARFLKVLRDLKITRLVIPNGYREHPDHSAAFDIGRFIGPRAGAPFFPELSIPKTINSYVVYSVWSEFSPEGSLINNTGNIRANHAIKVPFEMEHLMQDAMRKYRSHNAIMEQMMERREERMCKNGSLELYQTLDARPVLNYEPYIDLINDIDSGN